MHTHTVPCPVSALHLTPVQTELDREAEENGGSRDKEDKKTPKIIKINAWGWILWKGTTEETTSKVRVETSGLKMEGLTEGGRGGGGGGDSTYIIVQSLSLQAELRGGGVSKLRGEAQVWELHAATKEEHCGGRGGWKGGRCGHQNTSN